MAYKGLLVAMCVMLVQLAGSVFKKLSGSEYFILATDGQGAKVTTSDSSCAGRCHPARSVYGGRCFEAHWGCQKWEAEIRSLLRCWNVAWGASPCHSLPHS